MTISLTDHLNQLLTSAWEQLDLGAVPEFEWDFQPQTGDVSTNVALKSARTVSQPQLAQPRALAQALTEQMTSPTIDRIEVAGPGFINFYLSEQFLKSEIGRLVSKGESILPQFNHGNKVVVEYTDPNPFKEFHIGHLYSNVVGESIATLIEATGAEVWRADFFGDVGMHVAKSIWGLRHNLTEDGLTMKELETRDLTDRVKYLGKSYARGATAYEEDEAAKEEMKQLNFLAFKAAQEVVLPQYNKTPEIDYDQFIQDSDFEYDEIKKMYSLGRKWSLEYFDSIYARLGTTFKGYYPESLTGEYGYGMVMAGLAEGIFETGEGGAIIFPGEKHGLHNRVFINALGLPTYETKDFGNAVAKYQDFPYDQSVIITANEINEYFVVVLKALRMLRPDLGDKTTHIGHGMVKLPDGKMSSRTGKILQGEWLLEEAKNRILEILKTSKPEMPASQADQVAEKVGQAAIKYAFLKASIGKDIAFSFDESLSFHGNSGPYLQYTYVRCASILEKAKSLQNSDINKPFDELLYSLTQSEKVLATALYRFPMVVEQAAKERAPHLVCTYLYELAQAFNGFYTQNSVLGSDVEPETTAFRLHLVQAVARVLQTGLELLGIETVEKM